MPKKTKKLFGSFKEEVAKFIVAIVIFVLVKAVTENLDQPLTWSGIIGIYIIWKIIEALESARK